MAYRELNSFIHKFNQLWRSGKSAHLNIDTHAGEAWVGLRVRLGHAPVHQEVYHNKSRTRDSPSRHRRRVRRAAAREVVEAEKASDEETQSEDTEERAGKATIEEHIEVLDVTKVAEEASNGKCIPILDVVESNESNSTGNAAEVTEEIILVDEENYVEETRGVNLDNDKVDANTVAAPVAVPTASSPPVGTSSVTPVVANIVEQVEVFATAIFDKSSVEYLTNDDFDSLKKVLLEANHMKENILKIENQHQTNRKFRGNLFKHTLELKMTVKSAKLWESPKQYIWRNLGQKLWNKSDGTELSLVRIHMKN